MQIIVLLTALTKKPYDLIYNRQQLHSEEE